MDMPDWVTSFPGAVTVSDLDNTILWMNDKAAKVLEKNGGRALVGRNMTSCHNERSQAIIARMLETGSPNAYTIEKAGVRKFIYQSPWRDGTGAVAGLVELSMEIPAELPHYVRAVPAT
jgi:transcriptional regulator with PAS, ATPase and Fis domain